MTDREQQNISQTIDYFAVCQRLLTFGEKQTWKLIETLAGEIASLILQEFKPDSVRVEVKKFIIPETRHISVVVERRR